MVFMLWLIMQLLVGSCFIESLYSGGIPQAGMQAQSTCLTDLILCTWLAVLRSQHTGSERSIL